MRFQILFLSLFALLTAALPANAQQYQYDNAGRLTAALYPGGASIRYEYDDASNVTRVQYISGVVDPVPPDGVIDTPETDVTIDAGQAVNFTGSGTDPDNATPLTFLWDFDGAAPDSNDEDPGDIVFPAAGAYTVTFTVSDATGLADPTPDTVVVTVNPAAPDGVIDTPSSNTTIRAGQSVTFTGTGTDPDNATPLSYEWNFGGGAGNSTSEDPGDVTFPTAGTYTVTFTVTDADGLSDPTPDTVVVTVTAASTGGGSGGGGGGGGATFVLPFVLMIVAIARRLRPLLLAALLLSGAAQAQTWFKMESGTDQNLNDVWMPSKTLAYAVGDNGTVLRYDGSAWTPVDVGTTVQLKAVYGTGPNDVWIVGLSGTVLHFDGSTWTPVDIGAGTVTLNDVWTRGVGQTVYIVGYRGVWYDAGSGWAKQTVQVSNINATQDPNHFFTSIRGSDNYLVMTATSGSGADEGLFVNFDWVGLSTFNFQSVWVYDDTFMLAAGTGARLMDGGDPEGRSSADWQYYAVGVPAQGVWGADPQNIWAVGGTSSYGRIMYFDGNDTRTWTAQITESYRILNGIDGVDAGNVLVVGSLGTIYRLSTPDVTPTASNYPYAGVAEGNVNTQTGELVYETVDFSIGSDPLEFRRYYASKLWAQSTVGERLGENWTHNYEWRLDTNFDGSADRVRITDYRGLEYIFDVGATSNTLVSPTWANVTLTVEGGNYILVDHDEERMYGVGSQGLAWIEDRNGNRHTLFYNQGYLVSVNNGKESQIAFEYTPGGKIARVYVPEGGEELEVAFEYNGGDLVSATTSSNAITDYSYTGDALLTSVNVGGAIVKEWDYGSQDRVVATTYTGGGPFVYTYDGNRLLVSEPGATNRQYVHDDDGRLISETNGVGAITRYGYDSSGRRTSMTDPGNRVTSWTYDPLSGKTASISEPGSFITRFFYESGSSARGISFWNLTGIEYPDQTTDVFSHDAHGNVIRHIDQNVIIWDFVYDAGGRLKESSNPLGGKTAYTRTVDGLVQTVTDPAQNTTEYWYDLFLRPVKIYYPDNTEATLTYSTRFMPDQVTLKSGATVNLTYGNGDRISRIDYSDGSFQIYGYDEAGDVASVELPGGKITTYRYDARRNIDRIIPPDLYFESFEYDAADRLVKYTDPNNRDWLIEYNADDTIKATTSPSGERETFDYTDDPRGLLTSHTKGVEVTRFTYDSRAQLFNITDSFDRVFQGGRDGRGALTSASLLPAGINKTYERNEAGQIERYVDPNGGEWLQDFGDDGLLRSKTSAANETTTIMRDELNRISRVTDANGESLDLTYALSGLVENVSGSDGTSIDMYSTVEGKLLNGWNFWFDYSPVNGRLSDSNGIGIEYDGSDRPWKITVAPGLVLEYLYDQAGQLAMIKDWLGGETTISSTALGERDDITYPNGITTDYSFDERDRLVGIDHGALGSITLNRSPITGRVTSAERNLPGSLEIPDENHVFIFDSASRETGSVYDARGNLRSDGRKTFEYDVLNRLKSVTVGGSTTRVEYDAFGAVVSRQDNLGMRQYVNNYALREPRITVERDETGQDLWYYVHTLDGELLYRISPGGVRQYYHYDEGGNAIFMTDDDQSVVQTYSYSPFGALLGESGNVDNIFKALAEFSRLNVAGDVVVSAGGGAADHATGQVLQGSGTTGGSALVTGNPNTGDEDDSESDRTIADDVTHKLSATVHNAAVDLNINVGGFFLSIAEHNHYLTRSPRIAQMLGLTIDRAWSPYSFGASGIVGPIFAAAGGGVAAGREWNSDVYETTAGRATGAVLTGITNTAGSIFYGPLVLASGILDVGFALKTDETLGLGEVALNAQVKNIATLVDAAAGGGERSLKRRANYVRKDAGKASRWLSWVADEVIAPGLAAQIEFWTGEQFRTARLNAQMPVSDGRPKPGKMDLTDFYHGW